MTNPGSWTAASAASSWVGGEQAGVDEAGSGPLEREEPPVALGFAGAHGPHVADDVEVGVAPVAQIAQELQRDIGIAPCGGRAGADEFVERPIGVGERLVGEGQEVAVLEDQPAARA